MNTKMEVDYLFLVSGLISLMVSVVVALVYLKTRNRRTLLASVFCAVMTAGLVVQAFSPNLEIDSSGGRKLFVLTPEQASKGLASDLVSKEKNMKMLSALLMLVGVGGLAILYWPRASQAVQSRS